eukprot:scaffold148969_cov27-Tisochrysis_lutea.AAC.6
MRSVAIIETPMRVKPRISFGTQSRGKAQQSCPGCERPVPLLAMASCTSKEASTCSNSSRIVDIGTLGITWIRHAEHVDCGTGSDGQKQRGLQPDVHVRIDEKRQADRMAELRESGDGGGVETSEGYAVATSCLGRAGAWARAVGKRCIGKSARLGQAMPACQWWPWGERPPEPTDRLLGDVGLVLRKDGAHKIHCDLLSGGQGRGIRWIDDGGTGGLGAALVKSCTQRNRSWERSRTVCERMRSVLLPGSNGFITWVKETCWDLNGGGAAWAHWVNQWGARGGRRDESLTIGILTTRRLGSRAVHDSQHFGGRAERAASLRRDSMNERRTSSDHAPSGAVVGARGCFLGFAFIERVKARESCAYGGAIAPRAR